MHGTATLTPAEYHLVGIEPAFDFPSEEYRAHHRASGASAFQAPSWLSMLPGRPLKNMIKGFMPNVR